jgi:hypothetical protein
LERSNPLARDWHNYLPMTELTEQQEDELLRAEIFADDSGTNEQEEEVTESADEVTPEEVEETEAIAEEVPEPKKKSNVAKILAEKNEYKREAMEAKKRIAELEGRVGDDKETDVSYIDSIVDRKIAERMETQDFFSRNPDAREIREELDEFRAENPNLSYDRAYKFYLAETNPQALLDEQTKNKTNAKMYSTAGRASPSLRQEKAELTYSDDELD